MTRRLVLRFRLPSPVFAEANSQFRIFRRAHVQDATMTEDSTAADDERYGIGLSVWRQASTTCNSCNSCNRCNRCNWHCCGLLEVRMSIGLWTKESDFGVLGVPHRKRLQKRGQLKKSLKTGSTLKNWLEITSSSLQQYTPKTP
jgi:hypothetical protein